MFRKVFASIRPHIVPETIAFFTKMLPLAILISWIFMLTNAGDIIKPFWKLALFSVLWSLVGLYLCRIVAFYNKKVISGLAVAQGDVYHDPTKNPKS